MPTQHRTPLGGQLLLVRRVVAGSNLVQQHERRLAEPVEDLQFRLDVAGGGRFFRRVDDVQHDVRRLARRTHGLLAAPERTVREAIPHLREKPADRLAARCQAPLQAHAVAKSGRVPEHEFVGRGTPHQHVRFSDFGDVGAVHDGADVTPQQRPCQRRLADVGVRQQRETDGRR